MMRSIPSSAVVVSLGLVCAACGSSTATNGTAQSNGYLGSPGAPLVAPLNPSERSGTTAEKQRATGYFPQAGAPLVAPTTNGPQ